MLSHDDRLTANLRRNRRIELLERKRRLCVMLTNTLDIVLARNLRTIIDDLQKRINNLVDC